MTNKDFVKSNVNSQTSVKRTFITNNDFFKKKYHIVEICHALNIPNKFMMTVDWHASFSGALSSFLSQPRLPIRPTVLAVGQAEGPRRCLLWPAAHAHSAELAQPFVIVGQAQLIFQFTLIFSRR